MTESTPVASTSFTPPPTLTSKQRRQRQVPQTTAPSNDSAFRTSERYWKNRSQALDFGRALSYERIRWDQHRKGEEERVRGVWEDGQGLSLECFRIRLRPDEEGVLGHKKGKGKQVEKEEKGDTCDYAVIIPSMPGIILFPSILPPALQRSLVRESLRHSVSPNLTSLSPHYDLPLEGIWNALEAGQGGRLCKRISPKSDGTIGRDQVNFEPVTKGNWKDEIGRGEKDKDKENIVVVPPPLPKKELVTPIDVATPAAAADYTVHDLLTKLRWTTIGWNYDWTSKVYNFSLPHSNLPPLIHRCCKEAVRRVDWDQVFEGTGEGELHEGGGKVWDMWREEYEPDAGIVNFYQLRDTLTAHIDHSELDAVQPLVSFSIGHSAIFLIGGPTRDITPLAIELQSGDGLIMSGQTGRRVFHGVPRILSDTLPPYLSSTLNLEGEEGQEEDDWKLFGEFLEMGARINFNVRTVGYTE
ncbi:BQ5605_C012g06884 [Microbotryum silenes-dioicae]|uniref:BQ5605_C012g06884 protein n=1 Tax=Microbotryum silenes-dioicae TaxID=796604 RepID=A0A2X0LWD9_9BASI|nr:BQ5605_C012g06884 [Microbotryum silenes-dioicae]